MRKLTLVGGSKGIGFAILSKLVNEYDVIELFDIVKPCLKIKNVRYHHLDLFKDETKTIERYVKKSNDLIITAGIGQIKSFSSITSLEIDKIVKVNFLSIAKILNSFYETLLKDTNANCMIFSSIAGEISSPLFSVYGASKASLTSLCESLNIELEKTLSRNRITCIVATSFEGSSFYGKETDLNKLDSISSECISAMYNKETLHYVNEKLCKDIKKRYNENKIEFGLSSYDYKMNSGRISNKKGYSIGYMSGTFDLFHIGHLNILRKAKSQCDYLIVGVHESGAWKGKETFIPFKERLEIVSNIKYVDEAHKSFREDCDAWKKYHYDKLFVGSDYKGSPRFKKYENFFKNKNVEIIYFPYTKGTSSTKMREKLSKI